MQALLRRALSTIALLCCTPLVLAQVITGTYPYGTFDNKGFDTINVGNLNVHFSVPVLNKSGRGLPFYYDLSYDSSVWYPATVNGSQVWTPVQSFGWKGDTEIATGYLSYSVVTVQVGSGNQRSGECIYTYDTNWVYHDPFGVSHQFWGWTVTNSYPTNCGADSTTASLSAEDGSGYTLNLTSSTKGTIVGSDGKQIAVPNVNYGPATATDSNGNQISADGSGHFTDTTGNVVLTVSGSAPSAHTFTYTDTGGNPQTVSITYKTYTVQTAFGCNGIGEYGPTSTSLVNSLTLPDGSTYSFTYEATPNGSGNVTGRLASVTLPGGGTITYSYSAGSNGVVCADGSTAGLTRSIAANGGSAASTWTYTRTPGSDTSHTEVTDGLSNHSAYDFVQASNQVTSQATTTAVYYETNRNMYQGAETGTPLLSRQTCYNGQAQPCTTASFTIPISQIDTYETLNGTEEHGSTAKYNSSGLQTDQYDYDFGSSSRGPLLRHEVWTYGGSLPGLVTADQVYDGSGNLAGQTTYAYDTNSVTTSSGVPQHFSVSGPRGNLTSVVQYSSASTTLTTSFTYEDTGSILTATTPNGTASNSYDSTFVYNTLTTPPTPSSGVNLPFATGFDTTYAGLPTSSTDPNSAKTAYKYGDPLLRLTEIDNPDGGKTTYGYTPTQTSLYSYQNSSTFADTETLFDSYGRQSRVAVNNGQSSNPWYQQDSCYDGNGNLSFHSYSYQGTGWNTAKVCSGSGDSYTYDALGRITTITHGDGTSIGYSYAGRATKTTDENGVSRINQVDGLGRLSAVCEISSSTLQGVAPTACGLDISGTGFSTTYAYNLVSQTTTVTQGSQTRIFQTDWLGRVTSVTAPEASAPTTYSYAYNSTGLVVTRQRPQANQTSASTLTTTTTQYDSLGRMVSVNYSDGITPNKAFLYDVEENWTPSVTNLKGRLAVMGASTSSGASHSGSLFSYDAMGRVLNMWQCGPSTCATNQNGHALSFSYDWTGNLISESDGASGEITYTRSRAGEATSITNESYQGTGNPPNLVSSVANGPNGPTSYQLGNGLAQSFSYDSLGRRNGGWVCSGSIQNSCTGGTQVYGYVVTWKGVQNLGICDTVLNRCESFGYDQFNRLTSQNVNSGTVQNYTYVYDRYGNRWQQNALQGGSASSLSFNSANNHVASAGYAYDAAGNMTNDSIHTYTYDAEGNVLTVDGGSTGQYVYDALNCRVWVEASGSTYEYLYDFAGRRISSWLQPSNFGNEGRIYWDGQQIAYRASNGDTYFEHQDWLGTERMRTDYTGAVASSYTSLPFGDGYTPDVLETYAGQDNNQFAGLGYDTETTTDHAQLRQYSPAQGRWFSPDPYYGSYDFTNPQSMNRYSYVLNNPLSFVDPAGLCDMANCPCTNEDGTCNLPAGQSPLNGYPQEIEGSDGGGGPQQPCNGPRLGNCTNAQPVVMSIKAGGPSKSNCSATPSLLPHGGAAIVNGEATLGLSKVGATAQGTGGVGLFGGNPGSFFSYVATAVAGSNSAGAPTQQGGTNPTIVGAYLGVGGGAMITNATSV
jgi:RHS repeat-associated protein